MSSSKRISTAGGGGGFQRSRGGGGGNSGGFCPPIVLLLFFSILAPLIFLAARVIHTPITAGTGRLSMLILLQTRVPGKSKGFAFVVYEDQRSTILAVDNLNGATILNQILRIDHVSNCKKRRKRKMMRKHNKEGRHVVFATHIYKRGECNRGAACKFSHDEQHPLLWRNGRRADPLGLATASGKHIED